MEAKDRIIRTRIGFLRENPFFANLCLYLKLVEMPPTEFMQTAGIDYKGNFYFAPDYIDSLSDTDLNFVVAHETMHLALEHLLRKENRDKLIWNVAIDYAVNNMLEEQGFHYSKQGILRSDKFKGMSAEEIYDLIKKEVDKLPQITFDVHIYGTKSDGSGKSDGNGKTYGNGKPDFKKEIDNGEDEMEISEKEMNELSSGWKERVITAYDIAKSMGRIPAGLQRLVEDLLDSRMDWRTILRRFITNEYPFDYSWARPSKRSCSTGIYMPYVLKENIDIVIGIDTSGCFIGNTLIYTDGGIEEIQNIIPRQKIINSDFDKITRNKCNKKFIYTHRTKDIFVIRTKTGNEIEVTPNHKIFVAEIKDKKMIISYGHKRPKQRQKYLNDITIIEKEANELRKGEYLIVPNKINFIQREVKLPKIVFKDGRKRLKFYYPKLPEYITPKFAQLLGYILADGHKSIAKTSRYIGITDKNIENLKEYQKIAKSFKISALIRTYERQRLYLHSRSFTDYIIENFPEIVVKSKYRFIPKIITKCKDEVVASFIKGFYDGEGCVGQHHLNIDNTSEKLIKQLKLMLLRLGIRGNLYRYVMPKRFVGDRWVKKTPINRLSIYGQTNVKDFFDKIGVTRSDKKQKIMDIFKNNKKFIRNGIEYTEDLFLEEIVSIQKIKLKKEIRVFDLEIDKQHNYFANGILVHNSISQTEFNNFMAEIVGIAKTTNVMRMTVITCDCAIHEVHEITNDYDFGELKVSGYGGTDFRPVFKWIDENKPNTKLLVYFTDGMGEYPKEETVKTIWVYPKEMGKYTNPPFGESIVMGEEE